MLYYYVKYYLNNLKYATEHLGDNHKTPHLYYSNIRKHILEHHIYILRVLQDIWENRNNKNKNM